MDHDQISNIIATISQGSPEAAGALAQNSMSNILMASLVVAMLCGYFLVGTPRVLGMLLSMVIGASTFGVSAVGIANARVVHPSCGVILDAIASGTVSSIETSHSDVLITSCGQLAYMSARESSTSKLRYGYKAD